MERLNSFVNSALDKMVVRKPLAYLVCMTTILLPNVKAGLNIAKAVIPHAAEGFCQWWNPLTAKELALYKGKRNVRWSEAKARFDMFSAWMDEREALPLFAVDGKPRLLVPAKVAKIFMRQFAAGKRIPNFHLDKGALKLTITDYCSANLTASAAKLAFEQAVATVKWRPMTGGAMSFQALGTVACGPLGCPANFPLSWSQTAGERVAARIRAKADKVAAKVSAVAAKEAKKAQKALSKWMPVSKEYVVFKDLDTQDAYYCYEAIRRLHCTVVTYIGGVFYQAKRCSKRKLDGEMRDIANFTWGMSHRGFLGDSVPAHFIKELEGARPETVSLGSISANVSRTHGQWVPYEARRGRQFA